MGWHDAALTFPFGIDIDAANRPDLFLVCSCEP